MATVTLTQWSSNPATTSFASAPFVNLSTTTGSIGIMVNNPLISLGLGYWKEKTQKIGDNRNQESEAFTFGNLSAGLHFLDVYAINADESVYYNTGGGLYDPYWALRVYITVTSPAQCTFSNTPTVNSDVTGDTGAATGADATIARVDTNWSAACTKQVAWSYSTTTSMGQVSNGTDVSVPRGNSVYLYAGAPGATFLRSAATTIPYLSPKNTGITIANAPVIASADTGYWTATLSGVDTTKHTNYAVASSASTADSNTRITNGFDVNQNNEPDTMSTGVNGSTITVNQTTIDTSASNAPVPAGTTTMYLWCSRTSPSGGAGGQGWGSAGWQPVLDGSGSTLSFTVTRSNENVQNATGSYYDTSTDTGAKHSVTLTGLVAGKYYNVTSSSGNSVASSSTWANGSSAATATLTINDTSQTVPSGTGTTTTTYTMHSNSSASWTGASSLGTTYTRTLLNYDRYTPAGLSLDTSVNSGTYTLQNTISGHTYYIRKSSATGAIVGQATATGTSTDFTVTLASGDLGTTIGNQTTLYLTIKSPFNESPGSDYNSGKTITVTRTGTTQQGTAPAASTYGMIITNAANTVIYDTTSKIGRIAITGRTASVNGQASSAYVTVDGMANTSNWNVIVQPYESAATTGIQQRLALNFSITKENNQFKINNEQSTPSDQSDCATKYDYIVMRSG